eukprot:COSAG01_NODE_3176_length_6464_cov_54.777219_4_plen_59_part_00
MSPAQPAAAASAEPALSGEGCFPFPASKPRGASQLFMRRGVPLANGVTWAALLTRVFR